MTALKNNDKDDSGLKTILDFTSPENPILENTNFFFNQMKNSKYKSAPLQLVSLFCLLSACSPLRPPVPPPPCLHWRSIPGFRLCFSPVIASSHPSTPARSFHSSSRSLSSHSVLLGNFDKFEIVKTDKFANEGKQVAIVQMKVIARCETSPFLRCHGVLVLSGRDVRRRCRYLRRSSRC